MKKIIMLIGGTMGSGKTTVTELLQNLLISTKNVLVQSFTTDDYFVDSTTGSYVFDGTKIKVAHEWNAARVEEAMEVSPVDDNANPQDTHLILVHNTFGEVWETDNFKLMADSKGFFLINMQCRTLHKGVSEHVTDLDIVDGCSEKIALSFAPWLKPVKTRPRNEVTSLI